jgi:hypothetical protein
MKKLLLISSTLFFITHTYGQITNIKPGNWSDNTVWSNNSVPAIYDDVVLDFDVVVNINATCQSLNSNGHNITISGGFNLNIAGNAMDTLLSRFVMVDTTAINPVDTALIIDFSYDQYKRNTGIYSKSYQDGILWEVYQDGSRLPFKKTLTTVFSNDPGGYFNKTSYFSYQNSQLIADSTVDDAAITVVHYYSYRTGVIATQQNYYISDPPQISSDSVQVVYSNQNIVRQYFTEPFNGLNDFNFVYDDHPNPFYHTQNKIAVTIDYPRYSFGTSVEDIFATNNALSIMQSNDIDNWQSSYNYEYKSNGYPKTVSISSTDLNGKGFYYYSH